LKGKEEIDINSFISRVSDHTESEDQRSLSELLQDQKHFPIQTEIPPNYSFEDKDKPPLMLFSIHSEGKSNCDETQSIVSTAANTDTLSCSGSSSSFEGKKVGYLTVEERRAKVIKYLEKKKRRKYVKRIKYQRRQKVAGNKIRIQGRFVTKEQAMKILGDAGKTQSSGIKKPRGRPKARNAA
jgi:hypothetical protein